MKKRRTSLLEDTELRHVQTNRDETSPGDVCARCECPRSKHRENGCACGKCDSFLEEHAIDCDLDEDCQE